MTKCTICEGDHDVVVIHSRCHLEAPTWVWYNAHHDAAEVRCSACDKAIVTLALRPKKLPPLMYRSEDGYAVCERHLPTLLEADADFGYELMGPANTQPCYYCHEEGGDDD